jgi:SAM-dependent methyltransferase
MTRTDVWAAGDLDAIVQMIAQAGPRLVERAGVAAGMRVLDVGTGSGTAVAIPAAARGASVVGSDITDQWFDRARAHAAQAGVEVEWVKADVEALPFDDASFDRVLSSFGHIFAPHHARAAAEMARVTAPDGLIATAGWTQDGFGAAVLKLLAPHLPPPPEGAQPPLLWGDEAHAREMFAAHGFADVVVERDTMRMWEGSVADLVVLYETTMGPAVTARERLGEDAWAPVRAEIEQAILTYADGDPAGRVTVDGEYVRLVARR